MSKIQIVFFSLVAFLFGIGAGWMFRHQETWFGVMLTVLCACSVEALRIEYRRGK